ncbi:MAG: hypothetical protein ABEH80_08455 [Halobaculum sp.]|jgi:hypothetical protein
MVDPNGGGGVGAAGQMSTRQLDQGIESVCRATNCAHPELLTALVVFLLTAAFLLVAGAALVHLRDAHEAVAAERRRTTAERDAFEQFRRRVSRLETDDPRPPDTDPPGGGAGGTLVARGARVNAARPTTDGGGPPADGLRAVRRAYDETVMSTPHHAAEYDETLTQSMAAEFTDTVASTVASGSMLTPALRQTLVRGAREAERRREEVLSELDAEEAALTEATETLEPAARATECVDVDDQSTFVDLVATTDRLDWYERDVEALLADRQDQIHDHEADHPHWFDYLYGDLPSPHPVLRAGTRVLREIRTRRDEVASAVARR